MKTIKVAIPLALSAMLIGIALPAFAETGDAEIASAFAAPADRYTVQFVIGEGETVLGRPRLRVSANTPASITMPGEIGYRITIIIKPAETADGRLSASMELTSASGLPLTAPAVDTAQGEAKIVSFERGNVNGVAKAPLTVRMTVL